MSVTTRHRIMTIEDFLAWEARQEFKFEFDGFEPVAMTGGSPNHARIERNLAISVGGRLRGTPREFLGSNLKVVTGDRVRYPDGQVVCGTTSGDSSFATSPVVVFEVISPSTGRTDRIDKVAEYQRIASVLVYVILEPDSAQATLYRRRERAWTVQGLMVSDMLELPEIGVTFPLTELYLGVK